MSPYFIGIGGPSGAGKSTLAQNIVHHFPTVTHFKLDDYFKPIEAFPKYKHWYNREVPANLDWDNFSSALLDLKSNQSVQSPIYSMAEDRPIGHRTVSPSPIILVEGYLLFLYPHIANLFDLKLYLDVPMHTQLERKLKRQPDMDIDYFQEVTYPIFKELGEPTKAVVHHVIDGRKDELELTQEILEIMQNKIPQLAFLTQ